MSDWERALSVIDTMADQGEEMLLMEPRERFDKCLVGVCRRFNNTFALYSYSRVIEVLAEDSDPEDDDPYTSAMEFFEFNVVGGWLGEGTPGFLVEEE